MPTALHVDEYGAGAPLVALHGFGATSYTWHGVIETLAAHRRVYAVDLKGHGQSPKPDDGHYSMRDQAALILDLIAARGLIGVTLAGHSFGGGVALLTALELMRTKPGVLRSLILLDSPAYPQPLPGFIRVLSLPIVGALIQRVTPISVQVDTVLRLAFFDDDLIPAATTEAYSAPLRTPGGPGALRQTARQILPPDLDAITAAYRQIIVPTLLIWGRHDAIVPLDVGRRLHGAIAGSRLAIVERAGHVPHEETPSQVRPLLEEFLKS